MIEFLIFVGIAAMHLLTVPVAMLYGRFLEWFLHKYILHAIGRKRNSIWSFHWHMHHKIARANEFYDYQYEDDWTGGPLREKISLFLLALLHAPLAYFLPFFYIALVHHAVKYYNVHKYAHLHPVWARAHLKWHHDHHMGKDQNKNWGVTTDYFDRLFKTRVESPKTRPGRKRV